MNRLRVAIAVAILLSLFLTHTLQAAEKEGYVDDETTQLVAERVVSLPINASQSIRPVSLKIRADLLKTKPEVIGFGGKKIIVQKSLRDVDSALRALNAQTTNLGTVINLSSAVLFAFDSFVLRPDAEETLRDLLTVISAKGKMGPIIIEGHTDAIGTDDYNQVLSERRAASVVKWLNSNKVPKNRLTSKGFGEKVPVDTNETSEGRQKNRRVTVTIPNT